MKTQIRVTRTVGVFFISGILFMCMSCKHGGGAQGNLQAACGQAAATGDAVLKATPEVATYASGILPGGATGVDCAGLQAAAQPFVLNCPNGGKDCGRPANVPGTN